jgi:HD-GYP domain-containing protein (c-di-GMP phosphodiesterase class II)
MEGEHTTAHLREAEPVLSATVTALAGTLGLRDGGTGRHSSRVTDIAERMGRRRRLRPRALRDLVYAAEIHDIGKVGIPDAILLKDGKLTAKEWEVIRGHSEWGAELVQRIPGLERVAMIVRHHHERYDGDGYPAGLAGEDIPLESRVLAVADAFVAMTEDRPYRIALSERAAADELLACSGTQFDPMVVDALEAELGSNRLARLAAAG